MEPSIGHQALEHFIGHQIMEPSIGHQALEHSISHQALEHSISHQALEHSISHQALDLPSSPFSFSLKGGLRSWGALSFPGHNFQFNLEKTCSYELLEEEKNDQPW
jgi:hypothetical protein